MGKFFNKNNSTDQEPEDFILFKAEDNDIDDIPLPESYSNDDFQDTDSIDTNEIKNALENKSAKDNFFSRSKKNFLQFIASHRVLSICIAAVLVISIISASALGIIMFTSPLYSYEQAAAVKGNITRTLQVEGTLSSGDKYDVISLVSGGIIASEVEVGDTVKKGDILYKIDDTDAKLAIERAENELSKASDENSSTYRILASEAGTVQALSIKTGSTVTPGSQVGTIKRADGTTTSINSYISGTVAVVNVRTGQSLSAGQVIATVTASASSNGNTAYDKKSAELDLQSANIQLANCTIKSPINGIVIEKNIKVGDNVGITDSDKPMMVILDTSTLNFSFMADEKKVLELKKGQTVSVTSDSVPDKTFSGEVSSISQEGVMNDNNQLMFEVTVNVTKPEGLKAGMKVSATVVLNSKTKVLYIPEKALMESDGKKALVLLKSDDTSDDDIDLTDSLENQANYPWIKVPKGCQLITVKYGLSDGINTEILSGINPGDIVVYDPDSSYELVINTSNDNKKNSATDNQTDEEPDFSVDDKTDEEAEAAIEAEIEKILQNSNPSV